MLDVRSVADRHRCHVADKFGVFVDEDHNLVSSVILHGYLNFIKVMFILIIKLKHYY